MLGGPESLEPGALAGTTLGDLLPVDFRPRSGQRSPALALVIAFDKSGSMDDRVDGVARIEFARQAVRRVFETVPATDAVGVIAFDAAPHEVAALRAGQDVRSVTAALSAVQPGGGTAIAPAIEMAAGWLRASSGAGIARRHVLLVSDGLTSPADATRVSEIVKGGGFELSVVALGGERDRRFLESISRATGGRAYFPQDIRELPAIAARESARVAGGRLVEEPFRPRALPHAMLRGLDSSTLPLLGGYVVGVPKPLAEMAVQSPLNDPILAASRRGLGRVAVYSADLHSDWSASLRSWSGFSTLFVQAARWVARRGEDESLYAHFVEEGDNLRLIVEAETPEGEFLNDLVCQAVMRTPSGSTTTVALAGTAPGRYEASLAPEERGAYVFAISAASARSSRRHPNRARRLLVRKRGVSPRHRRLDHTVTNCGTDGRTRVERGRQSLLGTSRATILRRVVLARGLGAADVPDRGAAPAVGQLSKAPERRRWHCHSGRPLRKKHGADRCGMRRSLVLFAAIAGLVIGSKLLVEDVLGVPLEQMAIDWLDDAGLGSAGLIVALLAADVLLPIPSSLVMVLSGAAFGIVWGSLLSLTGSILGEWLGFELVRRFGRRVTRSVAGDDELAQVNRFFERHGAIAVLVTRPLPIVMETMSLAAGLSGMTPAGVSDRVARRHGSDRRGLRLCRRRLPARSGASSPRPSSSSRSRRQRGSGTAPPRSAASPSSHVAAKPQTTSSKPESAEASSAAIFGFSGFELAVCDAGQFEGSG